LKRHKVEYLYDKQIFSTFFLVKLPLSSRQYFLFAGYFVEFVLFNRLYFAFFKPFEFLSYNLEAHMLSPLACHTTWRTAPATTSIDPHKNN